MNTKLFTIGGVVLTVGIVTFVTVRAPATTPIAEQPPSVALAVTIAQETETGLSVEAVSGTLSDFWGMGTVLTDDLWLMDNADATSIVFASGDILTVYYLDGRPQTVAQTVAKVVIGSPKDFMELFLLGTVACGECSAQTCCDNNCGVNTCRWCACTARVVCTGGISTYSCTADPFECSYSCFGPGT